MNPIRLKSKAEILQLVKAFHVFIATDISFACSLDPAKERI
jgi:hypothetical protein